MAVKRVLLITVKMHKRVGSKSLSLFSLELSKKIYRDRCLKKPNYQILEVLFVFHVA